MEPSEKKLAKKLRQQQQTKTRAVDLFMQESLKLREGREFFYWLLGLCHIGHNPFTTNALTTSFTCGELNIGQQVQARIIEVAPQHYLHMLVEQQEEQADATRDANTDSFGNTDAEPDL